VGKQSWTNQNALGFLAPFADAPRNPLPARAPAAAERPPAAGPALCAVSPRYPTPPEPEPGPAPVPSPSIGAHLGRISHNRPQKFAREAHTRRRTSS